MHSECQLIITLVARIKRGLIVETGSGWAGLLACATIHNLSGDFTLRIAILNLNFH